MHPNIIFGVLLLCCSIGQLLGTECVPDNTKFYWTSPCQGQTFTNRVIVSDVKATQNGVDVDTLGGFNLSIVIDLTASINDQYGEVQTPLMDLRVQQYKKWLGKCQWENVPGTSLMDNVNACDVVDNCHLQNNPDSMTASLNVEQLLGGLISVINVGDYYSVELTFKDGKTTPILCMYVQDNVIAL